MVIVKNTGHLTRMVDDAEAMRPPDSPAAEAAAGPEPQPAAQQGSGAFEMRKKCDEILEQTVLLPAKFVRHSRGGASVPSP